MAGGPVKAGWVKLPVNILMDGTLSVASRLVWAYLAHRQGRNGESWPSLETIGRDLALSKSSAGRAVNELERMGLLQVCHPARKGRGHHLRYKVGALVTVQTKGSPVGRSGGGKGPPVDLSEGGKGPNPAKERSTGGKEQEQENKNHEKDELERLTAEERLEQIKAKIFRPRTTVNRNPQEIDRFKQQRLRELSGEQEIARPA